MAAGQSQQRPTAREGGPFKRIWFDNPVKLGPDVTRLEFVRAWDFARIADPLPRLLLRCRSPLSSIPCSTTLTPEYSCFRQFTSLFQINSFPVLQFTEWP